MRANNLRAHWCGKMTPVGFEPTQLALVELESTPLDHSDKVSLLTSEGELTMNREKACQASDPAEQGAKN